MQIANLQRYLNDEPYAATYGTRIVRCDPTVECTTSWQARCTGNPLLYTWHGGVVTGILQLTGKLQAIALAGDERVSLISANISFLRPAVGNEALNTRASVSRRGRQILNIDIIAWQLQEQRPTTTASVIIMLDAAAVNDLPE